MSRLYDKRHWRDGRRRAQLRQHPLCQECEKRGVVTAATVAHHVVRHNNNITPFRLSPLMSLCANCHDGTMQQRERSGFARDIGEDGWPRDPRHPIYKRA